MTLANYPTLPPPRCDQNLNRYAYFTFFFLSLQAGRTTLRVPKISGVQQVQNRANREYSSAQMVQLVLPSITSVELPAGPAFRSCRGRFHLLRQAEIFCHRAVLNIYTFGLLVLSFQTTMKLNLRYNRSQETLPIRLCGHGIITHVQPLLAWIPDDTPGHHKQYQSNYQPRWGQASVSNKNPPHRYLNSQIS